MSDIVTDYKSRYENNSTGSSIFSRNNVSTPFDISSDKIHHSFLESACRVYPQPNFVNVGVSDSGFGGLVCLCPWKDTSSWPTIRIRWPYHCSYQYHVFWRRWDHIVSRRGNSTYRCRNIVVSSCHSFRSLLVLNWWRFELRKTSSPVREDFVLSGLCSFGSKQDVKHRCCLWSLLYRKLSTTRRRYLASRKDKVRFVQKTYCEGKMGRKKIPPCVWFFA